ncbi:MAG: winged helix-turn-helix transcriptional regulator [Candidatus Thorarchaeota archaeon]|nr:MAG: winged helix-turn-helix transcriptional regulator [Candidatus Thorarchaeota archaeon]
MENGSTTVPMKDLEVIMDTNKIKVLFEPTRASIVFEYLVNEAMTVKQLSEKLNRNPGTILHHIQKLQDIGVVVQERTEMTTTGIVQRYYRATAKEYRLGIGGMIEANGGVAQFAKDRLRSIVSSLSVYGIEIPEAQVEEAMDVLRRLIERENAVDSELPIADEKRHRKLPPTVRGDASRIMRRFALEEDSEYQRLREEWQRLLRSHRKVGT